METTLFDLPLDLREIIYRRSRFLEARQRIAELLGPKRLQRGAIVPLRNGLNSFDVETMLIISPTKHMIVRRSVSDHIFYTVEVVDDNSVHVLIDVFREKVTLILLTLSKTASHVRINNDDATIWKARKSWWWHKKNLWMHLPGFWID